VFHAERRRKAVNEQAAVAQRAQHRVAVIEHLIRRGIFLSITTGRRPTDGWKEELPVALRAVTFVDASSLERKFEMRARKRTMFQHPLLVDRFAAQQPAPQAFIQPLRARCLVQKRALIGHALQGSSNAARLIGIGAV